LIYFKICPPSRPLCRETIMLDTSLPPVLLTHGLRDEISLVDGTKLLSCSPRSWGDRAAVMYLTGAHSVGAPRSEVDSFNSRQGIAGAKASAIPAAVEEFLANPLVRDFLSKPAYSKFDTAMQSARENAAFVLSQDRNFTDMIPLNACAAFNRETLEFLANPGRCLIVRALNNESLHQLFRVGFVSDGPSLLNKALLAIEHNVLLHELTGETVALALFEKQRTDRNGVRVDLRPVFSRFAASLAGLRSKTCSDKPSLEEAFLYMLGNPSLHPVPSDPDAPAKVEQFLGHVRNIAMAEAARGGEYRDLVAVPETAPDIPLRITVPFDLPFYYYKDLAVFGPAPYDVYLQLLAKVNKDFGRCDFVLSEPLPLSGRRVYLYYSFLVTAGVIAPANVPPTVVRGNVELPAFPYSRYPDGPVATGLGSAAELAGGRLSGPPPEEPPSLVVVGADAMRGAASAFVGRYIAVLPERVRNFLADVDAQLDVAPVLSALDGASFGPQDDTQNNLTDDTSEIALDSEGRELPASVCGAGCLVRRPDDIVPAARVLLDAMRRGQRPDLSIPDESVLASTGRAVLHDAFSAPAGTYDEAHIAEAHSLVHGADGLSNPTRNVAALAYFLGFVLYYFVNNMIRWAAGPGLFFDAFYISNFSCGLNVLTFWCLSVVDLTLGTAMARHWLIERFFSHVPYAKCAYAEAKYYWQLYRAAASAAAAPATAPPAAPQTATAPAAVPQAAPAGPTPADAAPVAAGSMLASVSAGAAVLVGVVAVLVMVYVASLRSTGTGFWAYGILALQALIPTAIVGTVFAYARSVYYRRQFDFMDYAASMRVLLSAVGDFVMALFRGKVPEVTQAAQAGVNWSLVPLEDICISVFPPTAADITIVRNRYIAHLASSTAANTIIVPLLVPPPHVPFTTRVKLVDALPIEASLINRDYDFAGVAAAYITAELELYRADTTAALNIMCASMPTAVVQGHSKKGFQKTPAADFYIGLLGKYPYLRTVPGKLAEKLHALFNFEHVQREVASQEFYCAILDYFGLTAETAELSAYVGRDHKLMPQFRLHVFRTTTTALREVIPDPVALAATTETTLEAKAISAAQCTDAPFTPYPAVRETEMYKFYVSDIQERMPLKVTQAFNRCVYALGAAGFALNAGKRLERTVFIILTADLEYFGQESDARMLAMVFGMPTDHTEYDLQQLAIIRTVLLTYYPREAPVSTHPNTGGGNGAPPRGDQPPANGRGAPGGAGPSRTRRPAGSTTSDFSQQRTGPSSGPAHISSMTFQSSGSVAGGITPRAMASSQLLKMSMPEANFTAPPGQPFLGKARAPPGGSPSTGAGPTAAKSYSAALKQPAAPPVLVTDPSGDKPVSGLSQSQKKRAKKAAKLAALAGAVDGRKSPTSSSAEEAIVTVTPKPPPKEAATDAVSPKREENPSGTAKPATSEPPPQTGGSPKKAVQAKTAAPAPAAPPTARVPPNNNTAPAGHAKCHGCLMAPFWELQWNRGRKDHDGSHLAVPRTVEELDAMKQKLAESAAMSEPSGCAFSRLRLHQALEAGTFSEVDIPAHLFGIPPNFPKAIETLRFTYKRIQIELVMGPAPVPADHPLYSQFPFKNEVLRSRAIVCITGARNYLPEDFPEHHVEVLYNRKHLKDGRLAPLDKQIVLVVAKCIQQYRNVYVHSTDLCERGRAYTLAALEHLRRSDPELSVKLKDKTAAKLALLPDFYRNEVAGYKSTADVHNDGLLTSQDFLANGNQVSPGPGPATVQFTGDYLSELRAMSAADKTAVAVRIAAGEDASGLKLHVSRTLSIKPPNTVIVKRPAKDSAVWARFDNDVAHCRHWRFPSQPTGFVTALNACAYDAALHSLASCYPLVEMLVLGASALHTLAPLELLAARCVLETYATGKVPDEAGGLVPAHMRGAFVDVNEVIMQWLSAFDAVVGIRGNVAILGRFRDRAGELQPGNFQINGDRLEYALLGGVAEATLVARPAIMLVRTGGYFAHGAIIELPEVDVKYRYIASSYIYLGDNHFVARVRSATGCYVVDYQKPLRTDTPGTVHSILLGYCSSAVAEAHQGAAAIDFVSRQDHFLQHLTSVMPRATSTTASLAQISVCLPVEVAALVIAEATSKLPPPKELAALPTPSDDPPTGQNAPAAALDTAISTETPAKLADLPDGTPKGKTKRGSRAGKKHKRNKKTDAPSDEDAGRIVDVSESGSTGSDADEPSTEPAAEPPATTGSALPSDEKPAPQSAAPREPSAEAAANAVLDELQAKLASNDAATSSASADLLTSDWSEDAEGVWTFVPPGDLTPAEQRPPRRVRSAAPSPDTPAASAGAPAAGAPEQPAKVENPTTGPLPAAPSEEAASAAVDPTTTGPSPGSVGDTQPSTVELEAPELISDASAALPAEHNGGGSDAGATPTTAPVYPGCITGAETAGVAPSSIASEQPQSEAADASLGDVEAAPGPRADEQRAVDAAEPHTFPDTPPATPPAEEAVRAVDEPRSVRTHSTEIPAGLLESLRPTVELMCATVSRSHLCSAVAQLTHQYVIAAYVTDSNSAGVKEFVALGDTACDAESCVCAEPDGRAASLESLRDFFAAASRIGAPLASGYTAVATCVAAFSLLAEELDQGDCVSLRGQILEDSIESAWGCLLAETPFRFVVVTAGAAYIAPETLAQARNSAAVMQLAIKSYQPPHRSVSEADDSDHDDGTEYGDELGDDDVRSCTGSSSAGDTDYGSSTSDDGTPERCIYINPNIYEEVLTSQQVVVNNPLPEAPPVTAAPPPEAAVVKDPEESDSSASSGSEDPPSTTETTQDLAPALGAFRNLLSIFSRPAPVAAAPSGALPVAPVVAPPASDPAPEPTAPLAPAVVTPEVPPAPVGSFATAAFAVLRQFNAETDEARGDASTELAPRAPACDVPERDDSNAAPAPPPAAPEAPAAIRDQLPGDEQPAIGEAPVVQHPAPEEHALNINAAIFELRDAVLQPPLPNLELELPAEEPEYVAPLLQVGLFEAVLPRRRNLRIHISPQQETAVRNAIEKGNYHQLFSAHHVSYTVRGFMSAPIAARVALLDGMGIVPITSGAAASLTPDGIAVHYSPPSGLDTPTISSRKSFAPVREVASSVMATLLALIIKNPKLFMCFCIMFGWYPFKLFVFGATHGDAVDVEGTVSMIQFYLRYFLPFPRWVGETVAPPSDLTWPEYLGLVIFSAGCLHIGTLQNTGGYQYPEGERMARGLTLIGGICGLATVVHTAPGGGALGAVAAFLCVVGATHLVRGYARNVNLVVGVLALACLGTLFPTLPIMFQATVCYDDRGLPGTQYCTTRHFRGRLYDEKCESSIAIPYGATPYYSAQQDWCFSSMNSECADAMRFLNSHMENQVTTCKVAVDFPVPENYRKFVTAPKYCEKPMRTIAGQYYFCGSTWSNTNTWYFMGEQVALKEIGKLGYRYAHRSYSIYVWNRNCPIPDSSIAANGFYVSQENCFIAVYKFFQVDTFGTDYLFFILTTVVFSAGICLFSNRTHAALYFVATFAMVIARLATPDKYRYVLLNSLFFSSLDVQGVFLFGLGGLIADFYAYWGGKSSPFASMYLSCLTVNLLVFGHDMLSFQLAVVLLSAVASVVLIVYRLTSSTLLVLDSAGQAETLASRYESQGDHASANLIRRVAATGGFPRTICLDPNKSNISVKVATQLRKLAVSESLVVFADIRPVPEILRPFAQSIQLEAYVGPDFVSRRVHSCVVGNNRLIPSHVYSPDDPRYLESPLVIEPAAEAVAIPVFPFPLADSPAYLIRPNTDGTYSLAPTQLTPQGLHFATTFGGYCGLPLVMEVDGVWGVVGLHAGSFSCHRVANYCGNLDYYLPGTRVRADYEDDVAEQLAKTGWVRFAYRRLVYHYMHLPLIGGFENDQAESALQTYRIEYDEDHLRAAIALWGLDNSRQTRRRVRIFLTYTLTKSPVVFFNEYCARADLTEAQLTSMERFIPVISATAEAAMAAIGAPTGVAKAAIAATRTVTALVKEPKHQVPVKDEAERIPLGTVDYMPSIADSVKPIRLESVTIPNEFADDIDRSTADAYRVLFSNLNTALSAAGFSTIVVNSGPNAGTPAMLRAAVISELEGVLEQTVAALNLALGTNYEVNTFIGMTTVESQVTEQVQRELIAASEAARFRLMRALAAYCGASAESENVEPASGVIDQILENIWANHDDYMESALGGVDTNFVSEVEARATPESFHTAVALLIQQISDLAEPCGVKTLVAVHARLTQLNVTRKGSMSPLAYKQNVDALNALMAQIQNRKAIVKEIHRRIADAAQRNAVAKKSERVARQAHAAVVSKQLHSLAYTKALHGIAVRVNAMLASLRAGAVPSGMQRNRQGPSAAVETTAIVHATLSNRDIMWDALMCSELESYTINLKDKITYREGYLIYKGIAVASSHLRGDYQREASSSKGTVYFNPMVVPKALIVRLMEINGEAMMLSNAHAQGHLADSPPPALNIGAGLDVGALSEQVADVLEQRQDRRRRAAERERPASLLNPLPEGALPRLPAQPRPAGARRGPQVSAADIEGLQRLLNALAGPAQD